MAVYAAWGDVVQDRQNLTAIRNEIEALGRAFYGSLGTMYNSVSDFMSWITPAGGFSTSHSITEVTLYEILDYLAWTLSGDGPNVYDTLQSIASFSAYMPSVDSRLSTTNTNLNDLEIGLTNYFRDAESVNVANRKLNTHTALVNSALTYKLKNISDLNVISEETIAWRDGSPLGNIALLLQRIGNNDTTGLGLFLDHTVGTTFGIWDSRTQLIPMETPNAWTPYSAIHGIYTYLAYLQRDVALMSWVTANPTEMIIRQDTEELNNEYYDAFVDPDSDNALSGENISDINDLASGFKENADTGADASGVWAVFDQRNYSWFSMTTKNNLEPPANRDTKGSDYPTPLLDEYYLYMTDYLGGE